MAALMPGQNLYLPFRLLRRRIEARVATVAERAIAKRS
jgi:hypothetical protein